MDKFNLDSNFVPDFSYLRDLEEAPFDPSVAFGSQPRMSGFSVQTFESPSPAYVSQPDAVENNAYSVNPLNRYDVAPSTSTSESNFISTDNLVNFPLDKLDVSLDTNETASNELRYTEPNAHTDISSPLQDESCGEISFNFSQSSSCPVAIINPLNTGIQQQVQIETQEDLSLILIGMKVDLQKLKSLFDPEEWDIGILTEEYYEEFMNSPIEGTVSINSGNTVKSLKQPISECKDAEVTPQKSAKTWPSTISENSFETSGFEIIEPCASSEEEAPFDPSVAFGSQPRMSGFSVQTFESPSPAYVSQPDAVQNNAYSVNPLNRYDVAPSTSTSESNFISTDNLVNFPLDKLDVSLDTNETASNELRYTEPNAHTDISSPLQDESCGEISFNFSQSSSCPVAIINPLNTGIQQQVQIETEGTVSINSGNTVKSLKQPISECKDAEVTPQKSAKTWPSTISENSFETSGFEIIEPCASSEEEAPFDPSVAFGSQPRMSGFSVQTFESPSPAYVSQPDAVQNNAYSVNPLNRYDVAPSTSTSESNFISTDNLVNFPLDKLDVSLDTNETASNELRYTEPNAHTDISSPLQDESCGEISFNFSQSSSCPVAIINPLNTGIQQQVQIETEGTVSINSGNTVKSLKRPIPEHRYKYRKYYMKAYREKLKELLSPDMFKKLYQQATAAGQAAGQAAGSGIVYHKAYQKAYQKAYNNELKELVSPDILNQAKAAGQVAGQAARDRAKELSASGSGELPPPPAFQSSNWLSSGYVLVTFEEEPVNNSV